MNASWIPTLLMIAAIALLPAWAVGGFALGAAATLWIMKRARERQADKKAAPLPDNVIALRRNA